MHYDWEILYLWPDGALSYGYHASTEPKTAEQVALHASAAHEGPLDVIRVRPINVAKEVN